MNQRIAVRAIVRRDDKTLLIKRASGRPSILGKYELPGGRLEYGEQPEDAAKRHIIAQTGLSNVRLQLFDVLTYVDHDAHDLQYTFILYLVALEPSKTKIALSKDYSHYVWKKMFDIQQDQLTESSELLLGISQRIYQQDDPLESSEDTRELISDDHVIVYSDGGSRGNPGPSASGFVIMNHHNHVIHEGGTYLGITTNNQAEYHGVRIGLEKALEIGAKTVDFRIDSLLVVNQMNNVYRIKNRELWPIHERIRELVLKFDKVTFSHVKREFNQLADGMVNKILDAHAHQ